MTYDGADAEMNGPAGVAGQQKGSMNVNEDHVYKGHQIYTMQLRNRLWAASIVRLAMPKGENVPSSGHAVEGIGGEFNSEEEAILDAKRSVDKKEERHEH